MNMLDSVEADFLAEFDLEDMRAIEDGDLSLFSSLSDATAYRLQTDLNMMHSNNSNYKNMNDMKLNVVVEEDEDPQDPHHSNTNSSPPNSTNSGGAEFNETPQNSAQTQEPDNSKPPAQPLQSPDDAPAPPPLVVCPIEVGKTSITLQKNQLCACKECGKLFKSIWYLKQHAVRHSNERPFKCNYCQKAFKFRSNLYQHNCPERVRQRGPNAPIRGMPGGPPNGTATPSSNK
ncbi:unnamed protein product [Bursaphelenchus okinawaensis]|uniref:C2H2-type domain-containing protein n=1 Tax=Bursaphelenchus okinawaensis TaxID=465554 RepID=A0A811LIJ0_9BILA|nr:unnamed protein product [Bursaphelenchus okinawaensis]CAG9123875.1 unnamed protein product [Bursaphelenchus okinawaensis]